MSAECRIHLLADGGYLVLPPNTRVQYVGGPGSIYVATRDSAVEAEAHRLEVTARSLREAAVALTPEQEGPPEQVLVVKRGYAGFGR